MDISNLEKTMYRTNDVGYYAFLKWYDRYIEDLLYKQLYGNTSHEVSTEFNEIIAYRIENKKYVNTKKGRRKAKFYDFYISKPYFDTFRDFDFKNISPRKNTEIIKGEDGQYFAKITTLKFNKEK